ncbi:YHYH protein [Aeoliella sp. ICT_H6.2]|uniref:YHYH protein n=1 Tax=Aeoliella straminimaris TaxID=2954799 RepID=A0A9X2JGG6_9BACT|nr:YHYH protein [Aeoliella straminimaris]MCO6043543.1 YHYH protein [Aeoliella straminimaris]
MRRTTTLRLAGLLTLVAMTAAVAQSPRERPTRRHNVTQSRGKMSKVPSRSQPPEKSEVHISIEGEHRVIRANGMPDHQTGRFPNGSNPNSLRAQRYEFRLPADPKVAVDLTPLDHQPFGIAINGVLFDPGAAEFYLGQRDSQWQYEPLSGAIRLGIDMSHAHVQPNGAYHYHGLPTALLDRVKLSDKEHSPLVGWAADGFPIYAVYGYRKADDANSEIVALKSSYRLKSGRRPGGIDQPGGTYDGTFVADYRYAAGTGNLDGCNGRQCVTPEFPEGTYAYFLTEDWPVIPRAFRGTPSPDFERREPAGRRRPPR